jgi:SAM-dependent methyltransferase
MSDPKSPKSLKSLEPEFFEKLYQENPDPWQFKTSEYEAQKYATSLEALPRVSYQSGFEIGGSIGVFTEQLSHRCGSLLSVDVSTTAQEQAKNRCRSLENVRFQIVSVPEEFPDESFDLIILSEVGYYWSLTDLEKAKNLILAHLQPKGHLLLVHWTVDAEVLPTTGDQVHEAFLQLSPNPLKQLYNLKADKYRLDLFEKI